jgi:serine protease AprX
VPDPPSPYPLADALYVAVVERPLFMTPRIPPQTGGFDLHLPGDVAQLTGASAAHRLTTPAGDRATGNRVPVAIIDTGFARHPYYENHAYNVTRMAAFDASNPDVDDEPHGTPIIANLFACAPDIKAYAIKHGTNPVLAIARALTLAPLPGVISLSWAYDLTDDNGVPETSLPNDLIPLRLAILVAVFSGVTVVAAGGNGQIAFPAMMPEVIAVGGVALGPNDVLSKWPDSSSFTSAIYAGRTVPDLCGFASEMLRPIPPDANGHPYDWDDAAGGTSSAAPQIAGICALLLQKNSTLTPQGILYALLETAKPVGTGTGKGLVNALGAWNIV